MDPLMLLLLVGGGAVVVSKVVAAPTTDADADDDSTIVDALLQIPVVGAVAAIIGEEGVEDVVEFFDRVDDLNQQNLDNATADFEALGEDLAEFDDDVKDTLKVVGDKISDGVHTVGETIFGSIGLPW